MTREIETIVAAALREDRVGRDITTRNLISSNTRASAWIVVKEEAVVSGLEVAKKVFRTIDRTVQVQSHVVDGQAVGKNRKILSIKGKARTILSGERVALNFLGRLSGIATLTRSFVERVKPYKAKILDTRKTTPGMRLLERAAVRSGGGQNHRLHLAEMVLIKDNHHLVYNHARSMMETLRLLRTKTRCPIEVEVETLPQFREVLAARPDIILLDNMTLRDLTQAVAINGKSKPGCLLEASGGIRLENVRAIAATGIDRISIGALTHSAPAIDFSLELKA